MLHYTLLATHMPVMPTFIFLYFCQPVKGLLQTSATRCRLYQEWWVGVGRQGCSWSRGAGPARPSPVQPTTTSAVSLEPPRLLSSIANRGGNVSLGVDQETSMPKQGASCPDTALPVGYVRTFLPFTLSPYMCLSPTPLAGCPSASCLRAMVCFFPPVCTLEVWKPVWVLVWTHFAIIQQQPNQNNTCCNKLKPRVALCLCVMHRRSQEEPDCWQSNEPNPPLFRHLFYKPVNVL